MRRKDKEITDIKWMEAVLNAADVARIAFSLHDEPYVIPMSFAYSNGFLFFHSAREGKKLELLGKNPRVCVEATTDIELVRGDGPCDFGVRFRSVVCYGTAKEITGPVEKLAALDCIARKYSGTPGPMKDTAVDSVSVLQMTVDKMTGKKSGW